MHRRWIIPITFVTGTVIGGLGLTLAGAEINADTVNACINKTSYVVRIRPTSACDATETAGQWVARTDTPAEVLQKIEQVDGQGSGLDASLLDSHDSSYFLPTTGKAADADKLDGLNSTAFAKRGASGSGTIGLTAIAANKCSDVSFGISGLTPGDSVIVSVREDDTLPANLTMTPLNVPSANTLKVRVCNPTNTASVADSDIKVRWFAVHPS